MNKMKKSTFLLTLAAVVAVGLAACQKDNQPLPEEEPSADVAVGFDENGASLALFSVAEGHTVRFSRGNLQHQPTTGLWRFAKKQYDLIGNDNIVHLNNAVMEYVNNTSPQLEGWIDLFSWFVNGWGLDVHRFAKNSDNPEDTNVIDWAWHNAIENGGNKAYFWRTLTVDEWMYLLQERPDAVYKRGDATVDGVNGMVILPDNWTRPAQLVFKHGFHSYNGTNVYTAEEWLQMQEAGAIFLPAVGCFNGENIFGEKDYGFYWTSTIDYDHGTSGEYVYVYGLMFNGAGALECNTTNRSCHGYAVRPVLDEVEL